MDSFVACRKLNTKYKSWGILLDSFSYRGAYGFKALRLIQTAPSKPAYGLSILRSKQS